MFVFSTRYISLSKDNKIHAEPILFGFAQRTFPRGARPQIHFRWGRILLAMLGVILAGWMSVAGALYFGSRSSMNMKM